MAKASASLYNRSAFSCIKEKSGDLIDAEKQYACAVANMREQLEAIGIELTAEDENIHYNFLLKKH